MTEIHKFHHIWDKKNGRWEKAATTTQSIPISGYKDRQIDDTRT